MRRPSLRQILLLIACSGLGTGTAVFGAERILLTTGFTVDCHHRGASPDGRTRLYLDAEETSFLDVEAARIASVENLQAETLSQKNSPAAGLTSQSSASAPVQPSGSAAASLHGLIADAGAAHNINIALLESVVQAESGGHIHAVSRTGARGLMQLMPGTARDLGVTDMDSPGENLRGGSTYLDSLLTKYHNNLPLALAAYNAGPGAVDRYHGIPPFPETRSYVARVIREFNRRIRLQAGRNVAGMAAVTR